MDRLNSRAFASGCTIDLAGVAVRVELGTERRGEAFEELLGTLELTFADPSIRVSWIETPISVPDRPSEYPHEGLDSWQEGTRAIYRHAGVTAVAEDQTIELGGDEDDLMPPFRYVFEPALTHVLARTGRFMLHAGAVARDGAALLLIGDSGQGKSTLCWAAAQDGWSLLSDDHTIVRATDGGYELIGLPKPLAVPEEVLTEPMGGAGRAPGTASTPVPGDDAGAGLAPACSDDSPSARRYGGGRVGAECSVGAAGSADRFLRSAGRRRSVAAILSARREPGSRASVGPRSRLRSGHAPQGGGWLARRRSATCRRRPVTLRHQYGTRVSGKCASIRERGGIA